MGDIDTITSPSSSHFQSRLLCWKVFLKTSIKNRKGRTMRLSLVRSFSVSAIRNAAWQSPEYGREKTLKNLMVRQIYNNYNYHLRRMPYPLTLGAAWTQYPWGHFLRHNRDAKLTALWFKLGIVDILYLTYAEFKRTKKNRDCRRQGWLAKERETV